MQRRSLRSVVPWFKLSTWTSRQTNLAKSAVIGRSFSLVSKRQAGNEHQQSNEEEKLLGKHYKLTEDQKFRNRFLQLKREHSHDYLGAKLAPSARSDIEERAKDASDFYNYFFISEDAPKNLSENGADLWTRIKYNMDFITKHSWNRLEVAPYDEWLAIQLQYERSKLSDQDKAIVDPLYQSLSANWQLALHVENLASILDELVHKYQNTYTFPSEDESLVFKIADEYIDLTEKYHEDHFLLGKLMPILEELTFLKQKLIMPSLSVRYPTLFK